MNVLRNVDLGLGIVIWLGIAVRLYSPKKMRSRVLVRDVTDALVMRIMYTALALAGFACLLFSAIKPDVSAAPYVFLVASIATNSVLSLATGGY